MEGFLRSLEGEDSVESTAWNVPGRKRMCEYVMATVFCLEVEGPLPADAKYCKFEWISERTPGSLNSGEFRPTQRPRQRFGGTNQTTKQR